MALLDELLAERSGGMAVSVWHDRGDMHEGEPVDGPEGDLGRPLGLEFLPAYAPELNPAEEPWDRLGYDELPDSAPRDVPQLDRVVDRKLFALHSELPRPRIFFANSPLRW